MGIKQEAIQENAIQGSSDAADTRFAVDARTMKIKPKKETQMNVPKKHIRKIIIPKLQ